jgi:hypothetical protein
VFFVIQQFALEGYINGKTHSLPTGIFLTAKGLNRAADLQRGLFGPLNKQVFVAMSFDKSLDGAWADGLKLGIEDCGYDAMRVSEKQHNEKICDVIIAEIRKSKFLVADFTLQRNGVYFEAGMMLGLGRPVILPVAKTILKTRILTPGNTITLNGKLRPNCGINSSAASKPPLLHSVFENSPAIYGWVKRPTNQTSPVRDERKCTPSTPV